MKLINITDKDIKEAKLLANSMGKLRNSITKGQGNVHGFLGEIITSKFLKSKLSNTYDYDIIHNNLKIDVKTKRVTTPPRDYYECSVASLNTKQLCDIYVFTRVLKDMTKGWLLGYINKKDYFDKAVLLKRGDIDPSNNWKVKTDCYNLPINKLNNIENLINETN
tara:strand:+ start:165 stop:659 length:495 start_codon:yes stop_codon:yes gene_type:complete